MNYKDLFYFYKKTIRTNKQPYSLVFKTMLRIKTEFRFQMLYHLLNILLSNFSFTLFPLGELNFHIISVGSGVMREVILNNTSKCPVTYEIVLPLEYQPDPDTQQPAVAKIKDNKQVI